MDYVRHGEIQDRSLFFFKTHCPCILTIILEFPYSIELCYILHIRMAWVLRIRLFINPIDFGALKPLQNAKSLIEFVKFKKFKKINQILCLF